MTVAAAQMSSSTDWQENLQVVEKYIHQAAEAGARIVVFPEATIASFAKPVAESHEALDGPFAERIRQLSREAGVVSVVGTFEPSGDGRSYNTLLITGRVGGEDVEARYRKIHLYDAFGNRESDTVKPGDELVVIDIDGVKVGFATCYDVRFADQFHALGLAGAQLVCLPAAWAEGPGKAEQWDLLIRSRAMDAQAWLVACDQAWQPPQGAAPLGVGRSAIIDPLGVVRSRLDSAPDLLIADIDIAKVDDVRARVPVLTTLSTQNSSPNL
ncbi:putative amidohydrolase [Trueperella bonasi]|uniref:Amidohydrolase n=1 Tax=Trueperella bonasi TaxID=312286 RepID=A0ABT9NFC0_9ACTO|nr:carbon-nitrogen hydrolase family protein [Trueperella bonasi]MDP9805738.1 putative amidohydrolase [Trueperella bonasi]